MLIPADALWRRVRADRVACFIDGEAYFRAFREAALTARKSLFIVGWDFNSRIALVRDGPQDGYPAEFLPFLNAIARERPGLRIYLLEWDFAVLYAGERETIPVVRFDWATASNIEFALDSELPFGASHHQKLVVVDDALAFVGGLDFTAARWDTAQHLAQDVRRSDPICGPYLPFHDVQAAVSGPAASALGELARERWRRATGKSPVEARPAPPRWPAGWPIDFRHVEAGFSRTVPAYGGIAAVTEVERLHLAVIAQARRYLYFENEYFTSWRALDAIGARLAGPRPPEVVLVLPQVQSGWLEQSTMGAMRARVLERLQLHDRQGRLRVYAPFSGELPINLHAKVFAADDEVLKIGSANLTNRSFGFDSELDMVIAAGDRNTASAVSACVRRLVAHHLGLAPHALRGATPGAWIRRAGDTGRLRLEPLDGAVPAWVEPVANGAAVFDPERPIGYLRFAEGRGQGPAAAPPSAAVVLSLGLALGAGALHLAERRRGAVRAWFSPRKRNERLALAAGAAAELVLPLPFAALVSAAFGESPGRTVATHGAISAAAYLGGRRMRRERARRLARGWTDRLYPWLAAGNLRSLTAMRSFSGVPAAFEGVLAGAGRVRVSRYAAATGATLAGAAALARLLPRGPGHA